MTQLLQQELRIIKAGQLAAAATGADGLRRTVALVSDKVGVNNLTMSVVASPPGTVTGNHNHGSYEITAYVLAGRSLFRWGQDRQMEVEAGDFVLVPAGVTHSEETLGDQDFVVVTARVDVASS